MLRRRLRIEVGTLALCSAMLPRDGLAQDQEKLQFDIGPEPLSLALNQFGEQSDEQVLVAPSSVENKFSPSLHGRFTSAEALAQLLSGTGLRFRFTGKRTFAIMADAAPLPVAPLPVEAAVALAPPPAPNR